MTRWITTATAAGLLAGCAATSSSVSSPLVGNPPPPAKPAPGTPTHARVDDAASVFVVSQAQPVWGEGEGKSYLVPALDILGFQFLLNQFDRYYATEDDYGSDLTSIEDNLHQAWVIDRDPFATNQFLHPYQGSIYHGFARSAGLNYWEALGYDFAGSAIWEVAGETVPPSLNDQITTSVGGSFLGEALFRMSSHLLESGGENPGFFRQLGSVLISPSAGFNHIAYGDRFDGVYSSHDAATYTRVGLGVRRNEKLAEGSNSQNVARDDVVGDFVSDYGLPGKSAYDYTRPFDYFHFEVTAVSDTNALPEDVTIRGLLVGSRCAAGPSYRGVWGLYGGYDYISPEEFSVSSTSVSLGTTAQWWLADWLALQGTALGGVGWTAAGTISDAETDRNYHYGASPQGLLALRFIMGDVAVLDMTGRAYYIGSLSGVGGEDSETILRGKVALTLRVYGHHAIGIQYVGSSRDARFTDQPDTSQSIGALSIFYTWISDTKLGAVEW